MQAVDAIRWLDSQRVAIGPGVRALDLGCGHGVFGGELKKRGCLVTFSDETNLLWPPHHNDPFVRLDLNTGRLEDAGSHDLVICSNVLEHLSQPRRFVDGAAQMLSPGGRLYLSWTNWLSPWGGHEFSPWHYLGPSIGPRIYDQFAKRPRFHTPYVNLFPTYIGTVLGWIRKNPELELIAMTPRYYTECGFVMSLPGLREVAAWNCALLLGRRVSLESSRQS